MKQKVIRIFFILLTIIFSYPSTYGAASFKVKNHHFNVNYDHQGLFVSRDDNKYLFNLYGYFEADFMKFMSDHNMLRSGSNIRYATLYLTGRIDNIWQYFVSYAISNNLLLDASIIYHGFHNQYIQVGQFTPNVGFSNWSRHFDINFLEWPLPVFAFSPGYPQGAHYNIAGKYFVGDVSMFGGTTHDASYNGSNPVGATGRLFFSPIHTPNRALHFGVSDWWQQPNGNHTIIVTTTPEAYSHDANVLVTTGSINQVDYFNIISGEFASVFGPWSFQTEYYLDKVQRKRRQSDYRFSGYYATLGYFLTGQSMVYAYPLGAFTSPSSIDGPYGDVQILARFSNIDLNDKTVRGGKEYNTTVGLNWFINHFVTLKFNVIRACAHNASNGKRVNAMIYAARAQMQF